MGCASTLTFSWGGNPGVGSLHRLRDAVERRLAAAARDHRAHARRHGGCLSRPAPRPAVRRDASGYAGTDLASVPRAQIRSIALPVHRRCASPTVPAINPDVTILHAQQARPRRATSCIRGIVGAGRRRRWPPQRCIVTVEEQVERLDAAMNAIVLPACVVTAASVVPGRRLSSYAQGYYPRDNAFYLRWDRDRARPRDLHGLDGAARAGRARPRADSCARCGVARVSQPGLHAR